MGHYYLKGFCRAQDYEYLAFGLCIKITFVQLSVILKENVRKLGPGFFRLLAQVLGSGLAMTT